TEVAVHPRGIRTVAQGLGQAARAVKLLREQHHARIRRPPKDRLLGGIPREDAALGGGEKPRRLEIAAGREQAGRLPQRVLQRRKPVGICLLAQPDESAQSCNSSSGTRW